MARLDMATPQQEAEAARARDAVNGPYQLASIAQPRPGWPGCERGCNAGRRFRLVPGERRSVKAAAVGRRRPRTITIRWTELINWNSAPPRRRQHGELDPIREGFLRQLEVGALQECALTLFAHKRRSVEALGLGWVTINPQHAVPSASGLPADRFRRLVEVALRLLGERPRYAGSPQAAARRHWPRTVRPLRGGSGRLRRAGKRVAAAADGFSPGDPGARRRLPAAARSVVAEAARRGRLFGVGVSAAAARSTCTERWTVASPAVIPCRSSQYPLPANRTITPTWPRQRPGRYGCTARN